MRILVAPDKFKDSLGAAEVAEQIAAGLRESLPEAEIIQMPVADGGEGTASVICTAAGGEWHSCQGHDPLGGIVRARYCTIAAGATAIMEMSEASGLWRVPHERRDPAAVSSFGTGEMLLHAASGPARHIIIGLGGSATNDGGFGMARALGFKFLDAQAVELVGEVPELLRLDHVVAPEGLRLPRITAAVDVRNPLLGERGATRVFGPQKGARPDQIEVLERSLKRLADVVADDLGSDFRDVSGAGAAGGLGFGLMAFCSAQIRQGFAVVAECIGLEARMREADVVVTGEGRMDAQTLEGKAPAGVARLARRLGKRIYAIVGQLESSPELRQLFDRILVVTGPGVSPAEAIAEAPRLLRERARELALRL